MRIRAWINVRIPAGPRFEGNFLPYESPGEYLTKSAFVRSRRRRNVAPERGAGGAGMWRRAPAAPVRGADKWRRNVAPAPGGGRCDLRIPFPLVTISQGPIQYKGEDLEPERGPGLGCFRFQLAILGIFIVLTPLSVAWNWPTWISAGLLFAVILLLLFAGQTIIFLLRLVAADRRGRRRPLASGSKTVGELEDESRPADPDTEPGTDHDSEPEVLDDRTPDPPSDEGPVR